MNKDIVKSYGVAKLVVRDVEITAVEITEVAYEDEFVNVSGSHTQTEGFEFSILNKKTNTMTFYKISEKGKFVEDYKENVITGDKLMLRDDIRDKVFELMKTCFVWITHVELEEKHELYKDLTILQPDIYDFAGNLETEFGLEEIAFATTMNWKTVTDIVNYIEDSLECALHDMEEDDA